MFKPNIKHLAFDDRLLTLLGIPLMALIIPFVFFGVDWQTYQQVFHQEYPESLIYTSAFWFFNRFLMITLRKRFNAFSDTLKRFALQFDYVTQQDRKEGALIVAHGVKRGVGIDLPAANEKVADREGVLEIRISRRQTIREIPVPGHIAVEGDPADSSCGRRRSSTLLPHDYCRRAGIGRNGRRRIISFGVVVFAFCSLLYSPSPK